jgi:hypothetical protein
MQLKNIFIIAYLAMQILLPLRYYVGDDLFDERFSWRMFSPIRMVQCQVAWSEERHGVNVPIQLREEVGVAWIGLMKRARVGVIDGFAKARCAEMRRQNPEPVVHVDIQCMHPDGEMRRPVELTENLCETVQ